MRFISIAALLLFAEFTQVGAQGVGCYGSDAAVALNACDAELADTDLLTRSEIAALERSKAGHLLDLGRSAEALEILERLYIYDGASEIHHFQRAVALQNMGRTEEALASLTEGLDLNPQHVDSLLLRADIFINSERLDEAVEDAGLAVVMAPDNPKANRVMAAALEAMGAAEAAARLDEAAESTQTDNLAEDITDADLPTASNPATLPAESEVATLQPAPNASTEAELIFWNDVKNSTTPAELELFLSAFPNSVFAPLAKLRLQQLQGGDSEPQAAPAIATPSIPATYRLDLIEGSEGSNVAISAIETRQGDILVAGLREPDGLKDTKPWLALYDHEGRLRWQKQMPMRRGQGHLSDVVQLTNGVIVVPLIEYEDWGQPVSASLIGVDGKGETLWRQDMGQVNRDFGVVSLVALTDGGVLSLTSSDAEDLENSDSVIEKFDATGVSVWRNVLRLRGEDVPFGADEADGVLMVVGSVKLDDDDRRNAWIHKFDLAGNLIWKKTLHSGKRAVASDVVILEGGDPVILGTHADSGESQNWVERLDDAGATIWRTDFGVGASSDAFRLALTPEGELVTAGAGGNGDYDAGTVGWTTWFDLQGQQLAQRVLGDRKRERFIGISITHDGGLLMSGDFGTGNIGDESAWIQRLEPRHRIPASEFTPVGSGILKKCVSVAAHPQDTQNPYSVDGFHWEDFEAEDARHPCAVAASIFPDNPIARYHAGRVDHKLENYQEALTHYGAAVELGHIRAMAGAAVIRGEGPDEVKNVEMAAGLFQRAVDAGRDVISAEALGDAYSDGVGVDQDSRLAVQNYRIAADGGSGRAQYRMAQHYDNGWGVAVDTRVARSWYEEAAKSGYEESYYRLAYFLHWGLGGESDQKRAQGFFERASDAGSGPASFHIASEYRYGGDVIERDPIQAIPWYRKAIEQGHYRAHAGLGSMYYYGIGVRRDLSRAQQILQGGIDKNDPDSHYYLGQMYEFGEGVDRDMKEAARLYEIAVKGDNASAMVRLGYMSREGNGVAKNETRAYELFKKAGENYLSEGQREAGWMLYLGRGVTRDVNAAIKEIEEADNPSDELAPIYLGFIYEGEPSLQDADRAAGYFYQALERGSGWPATRKTDKWHRPTARALQQRLANGGFYKGAIDGVMGPGSVAAMKALCRCE